MGTTCAGPVAVPIAGLPTSVTRPIGKCRKVFVNKIIAVPPDFGSKSRRGPGPSFVRLARLPRLTIKGRNDKLHVASARHIVGYRAGSGGACTVCSADAAAVLAGAR